MAAQDAVINSLVDGASVASVVDAANKVGLEFMLS